MEFQQQNDDEKTKLLSKLIEKNKTIENLIYIVECLENRLAKYEGNQGSLLSTSFSE